MWISAGYAHDFAPFSPSDERCEHKIEKVIHNVRTYIHFFPIFRGISARARPYFLKGQEKLSTILRAFVYKSPQTDKSRRHNRGTRRPAFVDNREATKFFQLFEPQGAKIIDKSLKSAILFRYAAKRYAPLAQLDRALVYGTKG